MNTRCNQWEKELATSTVEFSENFLAHAVGCERCSEQLVQWNELSIASKSLHKEWESPELWPRIHQAMAEESQKTRLKGPGMISLWLASLASGGNVLAALLILATVTGLGIWVVLRNTTSEAPNTIIAAAPDPERLLTEQALKEIESKESDYIAAIDKLSTLARTRLLNPKSQLLMNYREKLSIIDSAIAECKTQIENNRFNTHLRLELLSMYREKEITLDALMKENRNDLQ